uniref:Uncharacterized protein n=1 Tax=Oryza punctata TaxID=4537 RepID=A0A0E0K210_ORYPU
MDPEEIAINEEPEPPHAAGRGGGTATRAAFLLMVSGATMIIAAVGASAGVVPWWPRLLAGLLIWLVGCITLFAPSL